MKVHDSMKESKSEIVKIRRELHRIPEYGNEELKTQAFIIQYLQDLGLKPEKIAHTGVKAVLLSPSAKRTVAFRADMDGLRIVEETGLDFASEHEGFMHACGHDGHMAALLGFANYAVKNAAALKCDVVFLFQPAEESVGGAKRMIQEGALDAPKVDEIYGFHIWPSVKHGKIAVKPGAMMAHTTEFDITVTGKSAHGATPQDGIDAVAAAAGIVTSLHQIVSRRVSPSQQAVLTIGRLQAGTARNVIAKDALMQGIVRSFDEKLHSTILDGINGVLKGAQETWGVKTAFTETTDYPAVINDETLYNRFRVLAGEDYETAEPQMPAEDFSFFQQKVLGLYFFLGAGTENSYPLHSGKFTFDEEILLYAAEMYRRIVF